MATHGVVQARLLLGGRDMGPHLFICQSASSRPPRLRSLLTWSSLRSLDQFALSRITLSCLEFRPARLVPRSTVE